MPLTAAIADPIHPVARWFAQRFPHIDRLQAGWDAAFAGATTLRPRSPAGVRPAWPRLGGAIGQRIALAVDPSPPRTPLAGLALHLDDDSVRHRTAAMFPGHHHLAGDPRAANSRRLPDGRWLQLPPAVYGRRQLAAEDTAGVEDFLARLAGFITRHLHPPGPPNAGVERQAARACWALALFEELARGGPDRIPERLPPDRDLDADHLMGLAPAYAVDDLTALGLDFAEHGWPQLAALHHGTGTPSAVADPAFIVGWAEGDLVIGGTLIDVKATIRPQLRADWVHQLLGYTLLDGADLYGIRRVGIYLPRQTRLVVWPVDELLATLADQPLTLDQARGELADAIHEALDHALPGWTDRWITRPDPAAATDRSR